MKKTLLFLVGCAIPVFSLAQSGNVGINTDAPEEKLHVNGSMRLRDGIELNVAFPELGKSEGYSFLIKSPDDADEPNKITSYNQTFFPTSPAPINLIQFKIKCDTSDNDWIREFDTKINSDKFLVIISSFGFNLPTHTSVTEMTPVPQIFAYTKSGYNTWFLKADYESTRPLDTVTQGEWTLNLVVFDRAYAYGGDELVDMNGLTSGEADEPIIE